MRRIAMLPVLLALLVGASPAHAWTWPVDGPVLQTFSLGENPYVAGYHRGIDIAGPAGSPVRAPVSGTVSFAGSVPRGGRTITIRTADGYAVTLLHLGALAVRRDESVAEADFVAAVGPSGAVEHAEPYVHLGVRVASEPEGYVDPLSFLPARGTAGPAPDPAPGAEEAGGEAAPPANGSAGSAEEPVPAASENAVSPKPPQEPAQAPAPVAAEAGGREQA